MIKAGRAARRRRAARALPRVQPNVMMVTACGKERRLPAVDLRDLKTEHVTVEAQRALQVSDLEVNVAHSDRWMDRVCRHRDSFVGRFVCAASFTARQVMSSPASGPTGRKRLTIPVSRGYAEPV